MTKEKHHEIFREFVKTKKGPNWIPMINALDELWDSLIDQGIELATEEEFKKALQAAWDDDRIQLKRKKSIPISKN